MTEQVRIDADFAFDGTGTLVRNASVVFEGSRIVYFGESEHAPNIETTQEVPAMMPGMWECHTHYTGSPTPSIEAMLFVNPIVGAARCTWDLKETLAAGITSVREVGGMGVFLNRAVQEGAIPGPRIYGAGDILSMTGGHGDVHSAPLKMLEYAQEGLGILVDGVPECLKGVRMQLRKGAEIIKVCASGGVMSEVDHPIHQQFSHEELQAIVEEAERAERYVAAHCHGAPGIRAALEAGVKTIEHGTYLDEDLAEMMVEKDAILVPTRYVVEKLYQATSSSNVPEYALAKLRAIYDQHFEAMKIAINHGVKIAMGTDMFVTGPNGIFRHGENALEIGFLVKAGMKLEDALVAATGNGPLTVGKLAGKSGMLKEGYDADIILLKENPLNSPEVVSKRENILAVIKQGKFY